MTSNTTADLIRIVEYDPSYAGAVAEMWNRSQASWGGGTSQQTEDSVRREMETTSNLHVFLAVDGREVVGFCSFAHYRQDEGALYVPLLNVRPDYHGRKVGRNLILHAVRTTIEAGWPRLDLFTWAGNTKAVPMYKKCGFFWEKNDSYVHLMNFVPTVLQTEALSAYFTELDWYEDSTRELLQEPDGRRERGFDFFDYTWLKGELALRAEFEKSGRGLTALDTPDYEITTEIDEHDLVFGSSYKVRYRIVNRSAAELPIEIKAGNDKNIRFELAATHTLVPGETWLVEGEFTLDPVLEEQNDKKTHPVVKSSWLIGGKRAEFRIGVAPKFPLKMDMVLPAQQLHPGLPAELHLNVENNFAADAEFRFELPEAEFLEWADRAVSIKLPAKGKASVPLSFILRAYGLYSREAEVTAVRSGEKPVTFAVKLSSLMKGLHGRFGGQHGDQWVAVNGAYSLHMSKLDNGMWIESPGSNHSFWWAFPRLGKPFAEEFSKKRAKDVQIYPEGEDQMLAALYESEAFPGLTVKTVVKLSANGLAEFYHEVCNDGAFAAEDVYVMANFGFFGSRLILPYQDRVVDMGDGYAGYPDSWDSGNITENWLFSHKGSHTCGICWDPSLKLLRPEYTLGLEHPLGGIAAGETVRTKHVTVALHTFRKWSDFRAFARKRRDEVVPVLDDHLELTLNGGNPFAAGPVKVELNERKMTPLAGNIEFYLQSGSEPERPAGELTLAREQDLYTAGVEITGGDTLSGGAGQRIRAVYNGEDRLQERAALWLPQQDTAVDYRKDEGPAGKIYTVSNGVLSIAASPGFGAAVYSLKYLGEEWLDSSFPEPGPRSWWNPWLGGLGVTVPGLGGFSRQQEPQSAAFVRKADAFGNVWQGLQLTLSVENNEANQGITVRQHYLMLPGVPVLCVLHSVANLSGKALPHYSLLSDSYLRPSPVYSEGWMELPQEGRFPIGTVETELEPEGMMRAGAVCRKDVLHAVNHYPNQQASVYVNNKVFEHSIDHRLSLRHGETVWTQPSFLILGELNLSLEDVRELLKLTFDQTMAEKEDAHADH
ncbi:GNAT family N-acetyltransferase ['Paenibacillus yunnanensis' Narsing Rao et al. 2020]|uniref:GNAT family N-acetyltransferase n=1 Tax=Paenibacillus tengchongensis TaxID=2608684 RepID=UPI00124BDC87|nr:GNAT family N-acetyltransferase [Paenibacillus tengchongensis]